jgi:glycosyltransferase involved in cell wall biosynthesis
MPQPHTPRTAPIEIVHLAYALFPADVRVRREAVAVSETGHRVAVIALRAPGTRPVERYGELTVLRVPGRKSRGGFLSYLLEYLAFVGQCRRLLARHPRLRQVKLVHVHTLPDFLVWAATPARRRGAKLVFDMHEIAPEFIQAKFRGLVARLGTAVARALERQARTRADLTIVVNQPIDALLAARPLARAERRILVHNSADPQEFGPLRPPAPRPPDAGPLHLVYHGTLSRLYGLDVAIMGVVRARGAGLDVRLTILGDGPERRALERLVSDLGAGAAITLAARVPPGALVAPLLRADAGVVPTRLDAMTRYSLSNKLLEYVHLGIPVLAARLPSYATYLAEPCAWFFDPDDPDDLARAIRGFARATQAERAARAAAAQRAVAGIAWPIERARLLAAYGELLGAAPRRSVMMPTMRSAARPSP